MSDFVSEPDSIILHEGALMDLEFLFDWLFRGFVWCVGRRVDLLFVRVLVEVGLKFVSLCT